MSVQPLSPMPSPNSNTEAQQRQYGLRIVALSDDYLTPTENVYGWKLDGGSRVEAPAMLKLGKTYFMLASMMTGWDANDNQYTTSTSLSSGWSGCKKFAEKGSNVRSLWPSPAGIRPWHIPCPLLPPVPNVVQHFSGPQS